MRRRAFERDGGACQGCGLDLAYLEARLADQQREAAIANGWHLRSAAANMHDVPLARLLRDSGFDPRRSLWECDHARPLADGGRHELAWVWTLCQVCHERKTAVENGVRNGLVPRHELPCAFPSDEDSADAVKARWIEYLKVRAKCRS
jgi:hypothetical protein